MSELISVIMSVYNAEKTLSEAVESILSQTHTNIQFIICDDASTDRSYELLQQYAHQDSRILLIQNSQNSKLSFSLNHCLQYVEGEYVARMDADDISAPDRLEIQLDFLKNNPQYDLVGTGMQRFDENGMADIWYKPETVDKYALRKDVPFNHATILTYKRVYDSLGGYTVSERTIRAQDYDLWFRFYAAGFSGYNIQAPLYYVREDMAAIRRRTFKVRLNGYKTTCIGFKMLGFPKWWLIEATASFLIKSIVPYWAVAQYRQYQKRKLQEQSSVSDNVTE